MEVKNPMMDQLLVNTATQASAKQTAKAAKDAERPDFDNMVQKRSAEKDAPKAEKAAKAAPKKAADVKAPAEEAPVTGEQAAIAVALMMQAPPDGPRMAQIQPELIAAESVITVEAVLADNADASVELPEMQIAPEVQTEAAAEIAPELTATPETADAQPTREAPVQTQPETVSAKVEERPVDADEPERTEAQTWQTPRMAEDDAPRTEKAPEAPRFVRNEEQTDTEDDAGTNNAQAAAEAPLFNRVDTTVVKVAEVSRPIPLEAEDGVEQLGTELGDVIVNSADANRVEIQLTPENLGKLTVEITRHEDGTLNVVLHTENHRTASLLEKGMDGLRQVLAANNEREVQIQVRGNEETQQQFLNPDGQNEQNRQQQQQRHGGHRNEQQRNAQDFLQQLRLGLVDVDDNK